MIGGLEMNPDQEASYRMLDAASPPAVHDPLNYFCLMYAGIV